MTSLDTLPLLDANRAAPQDAVASVAERGHCVVRALASTEELAPYRDPIERAIRLHAANTPSLQERDTYGRAFLQVGNLHEFTADDHDRAIIKRFVFAQRFARVAAELLGVPAVRLYHDQALAKEPGGGFTPWHQDQVYWPLATDRTITMWMPLVDVPIDVGSMTFADGTHREGDLGEWVIGDESEAEFERVVNQRGFHTTTHGAMRAGDATFHLGWTLHRAPANGTDLFRSVMTVIYFADGTRVGPIDSPYRKFDAAVWLSGAAEGALANSPRNPMLWPT